MAIKKYIVEVVRTDEYEIEIDDSIWTDNAIGDWSEYFFETEEDNRQEEFVKHLAESITSQGIGESIEGFGYVKQKPHLSKTDDFPEQCSPDGKIIVQDQYTLGLSVSIISYDKDLKSEIFKKS
jgi:hypothetical protein